MPLPTDQKRLALAKEVVQAFDDLNGVHPGHRPAHAKGKLLAGSFTPTKEAAQLSIAPHFQALTPVLVRFSDFAGVPTVADNDPNFSSPKGCAVRFQLGDHVHTDIVAHSTDGFPVRTAPEFVEFLRALKASGPDVPHPNPIEQFLGKGLNKPDRFHRQQAKGGNRRHGSAHRVYCFGERKRGRHGGEDIDIRDFLPLGFFGLFF